MEFYTASVLEELFEKDIDTLENTMFDKYEFRMYTSETDTRGEYAPHTFASIHRPMNDGYANEIIVDLSLEQHGVSIVLRYGNLKFNTRNRMLRFKEGNNIKWSVDSQFDVMDFDELLRDFPLSLDADNIRESGIQEQGYGCEWSFPLIEGCTHADIVDVLKWVRTKAIAYDIVV